jgi:SAM-dependent methyltransferase
MPDPQNIYDQVEFFAGYRRLRQAGTGLNEVLEQPALGSLLPGSLEGMRVLDLGCGFGDFARRARRMGAARVVGIDASARMLAEAERLTRDPGIEFRRARIEGLEPEALPYDLVVSSLCLHYVQDYPGAMARVARLLRSGGRFVFSVEHPMCTARAQQQWIRDPEGRALYWPVDDYHLEGARSTHWFVDHVVKYHRTVEAYVNGLLEAGFQLRRLLEPKPLTGPGWEQVPDLDLHFRRPPFLLLAGERQG